MSLIEKTPESFSRLDLSKAKRLKIAEKIRVFSELKYPESTWWYHNVIGIGTEQDLTLEERLSFYKHLCENDLYYFAKFILKKNKIREYPNRGMAEALMLRKKTIGQDRKMIIEPRETYKTTMLAAFAVWRIVKDRNVSILVFSETDKQATDIYQTEKEEMEMNELLQMIWGKFRSDRWNETKLFVNGRTLIRRDPTLCHAGNDSSVNGVHPDIAILDDVCSNVNTQTSEQRDKVYENYQLLTPLVQKNGEIIIGGTRWCEDDIYDRIARLEKELFSYISIRSAEEIRPDGKLYGEDIGLTQDILDQKKITLGLFRFSANYLNNPVPDVEQSFDPTHISFFSGYMPMEQMDGGERQKTLAIYLSLDSSWADKNSATGKDPTALLALGIEISTGNVFLLDLFYKRVEPDEVVNQVFEFVKRWNPIELASEHIGTQKGINKMLKDEMGKRGVWFSIKEVKHQHTSKPARIKSLQPLFATRSFFCNIAFEKPFMEEYRMFNPAFKIAHDDILDALEMGVSEYRQVGITKNEEESEKEYNDQYAIYDPDTGRM